MRGSDGRRLEDVSVSAPRGVMVRGWLVGPTSVGGGLLMSFTLTSLAKVSARTGRGVSSRAARRHPGVVLFVISSVN